MLAGSALLFVWSYYVSVPVLLVPSLSLLLLGLALLFGGIASANSILLPSLFLLLAVPIPSVLVNEIIDPLQRATALGSTWILNLVGIETATHAEFIIRESNLFQVIESCAGLRMIETMFMSAILYSELFRTTWRRTAILIGSVPVLSVLCNQIRVISIVLNPYSSFAAVHTAQGLVMIVVGVLLLAVVDGVAARLLGEQPGSARVWRVRRRTEPVSFAMLGRLVVIALGLAAASAWLPNWEPPPPPSGLSANLPGSIGEWNARGLPVDKQFLGSTRYDEGLGRRYWRGEEHVDLFLARDLRLDPSRSLVSPKTERPGPWFSVVDRANADLLGRDGSRLVVSNARERHLVRYVRIGMEGVSTELLRVALALDRGPWRRPGHALVVRLSTPIENRAGGLEEADGRIDAFLSAAEVQLGALFDVADASPRPAGSEL